MFKFLKLSIVFIVISHSIHSQSRDFNGIWYGVVNTSDKRTLPVTVLFENNKASLIVDGERFISEKSWSEGLGQQSNYVWMNNNDEGGWTESQIYSFVWLNENQLSLYFMRHVSNKLKDVDGNKDWGYLGTGILTK